MSNSFFHPSLILIAGSLLLPLIKGPLRKPFILCVPLLAFVWVLFVNAHPGVYGVVTFMDRWELTFGRVDNLSAIFAAIMGLMAVIGTLYSLHIRETWQHVAAWFYVAGSLGVIYSGDYLSLFLFWEMMAFSSTFLIWFNKEQGAIAAGYRYILVHTFGGVILLLGFVLKYQATGDLSFTLLDKNNTHLYTWLIMTGLMLNAAVVPFHSWLPDAYSKASITGAVFMCAFTTKTAVYALARGFAGFDILVALGVIMACYGIIYALMENDIRRLLSWEIVSQVGYMVAGVGIGTTLAINGTCAHAVAHILYKGLLFMGAGAIISATGKTKLTELGGLYKKMPRTLAYIVIGGVSVSAFPFFSGFVSKSMIIAAGFEEHLYPAAFLLTMVSAGTFLAAGLRLPYFLFFAKSNCDKTTWDNAKDSPWNTQLAMLITSVLCFAIGTMYHQFYHLLPFQNVEFHPYSSNHLSETLQILSFTAIGFYLLKDKLLPRNTISLDLDWIYRKGGRGIYWLAVNPIQKFDTFWGKLYKSIGLIPLMRTASFWSWFDWNIIDGIVDGLARLVKTIGQKIAIVFQRGHLQQIMYYSISFAALALIVYVYTQFV